MKEFKFRLIWYLREAALVAIRHAESFFWNCFYRIEMVTLVYITWLNNQLLRQIAFQKPFRDRLEYYVGNAAESKLSTDLITLDLNSYLNKTK